MVGAARLIAPLLLVLLGSQSTTDGRPRAPQSIREVAMAHSTRLRRLYVDAHYSTKRANGVVQTDRGVCAYAPGLGFVDMMHFTGPGTEPWRDPARFQGWIGPETLLYWPFKRLADFGTKSGVLNYWDSHYCRAIAWHPQPEPEPIQRTRRVPIYFDELFASPNMGEWSEHTTQEKIDSIECIRLETKSGSIRLWLATALGFALVKELTWLKDDFKTVETTYQCRHFKEAIEGVWLPWEIETKTRIHDRGIQKVELSTRITVSRVAINEEVPMALFEWHLPPGTIVTRDRQIVRFVPGGESLLDLWGTVCFEMFQFRSDGVPLAPTIMGGTLSLAAMSLFFSVIIRGRSKRQSIDDERP